ncbi:MAG: hypothetical protein HQK83_06375 [Fibrobacteria bacterium]|nr:hypothetical protein [Fibrobacteria bacterium]
MDKPMIREIIYKVLVLYSLLFGLAWGLQYVFHLNIFLWFTHYVGYVGLTFICLSFLYTLRKRWFIYFSSPRHYLTLHEFFGVFGIFTLIIYAFMGSNIILSWSIILASFIIVGSCITAKIILQRTSRELVKRTREYILKDMNAKEINDKLYWDSISTKSIKRWRLVHIPMNIILALLAIVYYVA